ncbi:MAG: PEP-CTERM sorting domain-containing protein, partial [Colwellia sp.]|nr:PEP-CTERM sorting domain-containing protein [Colwellia sp.]
SFIHSFSHWNTLFTEPDPTESHGVVLGAGDLLGTQFQSQWSWSVPDDDNIENLSGTAATDAKEDQRDALKNVDTADYATFYIRVSQVPEPSTLMIFSLGLIALASRKKLIS